MKVTPITQRLLVPVLVVFLGFSSCKKDIRDVEWNNTGVSNNNGTSVGLTEDEKLRQINISIPAQIVKTAVDGSTLKLVYTEDLSALLDPKGYDLSYSIRLNEDFSASALNGLQYTTPGPNGTYTTGWHGNDLKVLSEVTKTDAVVNGKTMVKLHLLRTFTFTKQFASAQEAVNQQNTLLNTKTDAVKFTSYVVFGKDYPASTATAALVYTK
ncbi:hypothetical protein CLV57_2575 [Mucilaginibacter auburnensis]|uniref:Uncharacterized protein n=2 Tax=Mucilaginibacter auburnensis TaxID=1457233 RepID=A0A2H9VM77_9SPHI|nr:hypothetical protein CLV57_2575 [Mucilaginibacter auburnensis]